MSGEAQGEGAGNESLAAAEAAVRDAVAKHGTTHAVVLEKLEQFVALLYKAGDNAKAAKLEERAKVLRQILSAAPEAVAAHAAPQAVAVHAASEAVAAHVAPQAAAVAAAAPPAAAMPAAMPAAESHGESEINLFNSAGEHVATVCGKAIYTPEGQNIGRWNEELGVYLDRNGSYLGEIVEENRLARDPNWHYRHMNFGDRGNEGDRSGWGRRPDIGPAVLPRGWDDVKLD